MHDNTNDWFNYSITERIRKNNYFKIGNIYSITLSFYILLERNTKRGYLKLHPFEVMDVKLGRSNNQFIHINITFHYQWTVIIIFSIKCTVTKPDRIQIRKIYYSFIQIIQILDITVEKDRQNELIPNSIEFKLGRSIHWQYHHLLYLLLQMKNYKN